MFDLLGVVWLMRRTHSPAPHLLLRGDVDHLRTELQNDQQVDGDLSPTPDFVQVPS